MRLKRIVAENFKGMDFGFDLSPVNVIVGKNFTGKTAIQDAIRVALSGCLARLGKSNQATWDLAGERSVMKVQAFAEPAGLIEHTWTKDAKGSVKYVGAIPPELTVPPVLLDPQVYFGLTSEEKVKMVFRAIPVEGIDWNELLTQEGEDEPLVKKVRDKVKSMLAMSPPSTPQVIMQSCIDDLKDARKESATLAKSALATVDVCNKHKPAVRGKILDKGPEILLANQKATKLSHEIELINSIAVINKIRTERRKTLTAGIEALDQAGIDNLARESADLVVWCEKLIAGFTDRAKDLKARGEALSKELTALKDEAASIKDEADNVCEQLLEVEPAEKCSNQSCPHEATINNIKAGLQLSLSNLQQKTARNTEAQQANKAAWIALEKSLLDTATLATAHAADKNNLLKARTMLGEVNQRLIHRAAMQNELKGLQDSGAVDTEKIPPLQKELEEAKESLAKLQEEQKTWTTFIAWKKTADQAEVSALAHSKRLDQIEKLIGVLQSKQEEVAAEAFNTLLAKSDLFTNGILLSQLQYRNGELGRMQGRAWVTYKTFSGVEELLAYAGLCVALAQSSPIKVVLMDELGVLDSDNKNKLIDRMVDLYNRGEIDLFVGIDVDPKPYNTKNVNIIQL